MTGPRIAALALALLAVVVIALSASFPGGSAGVPGPALVPILLGVALLLVSSWLVRAPGSGPPAPVRLHTAIPATMALWVVYATLWGVVPYGVLTGVMLLSFLKLTGITWRPAIVAATVMAVTLQTLFEQGLGVRP